MFSALRNIARLVSIHLVFILGAYATLVKLQMDSFADDPGVGWHLKTGEWIFSHHQVPHADPFLSEARSWICDQWLSDLLLYILYRAGSWQLIYATFTVLFILIFFGILYRAMRHSFASPIACSCACFIAFKMGLVHFTLRPVMLSFLCLALLVYLIFNYRLALKLEKSDELTRAYKSLLIFAPIIFLFWCNLHPSFVLGLAALTLLLFGMVADKFLLEQSAIASNETHRILALLVLCGAVTLINPNGPELHRSILQLGQSDLFMNLNIEWKPLNPRDPVGSVFELSIFLLCLAPIFKRIGTWGFFELFLLIVFAHTAWTSVRFLPYFAILAAVPLAEALHVLVGSVPLQRFAPLIARLEKQEKEELGASMALSIGAAFLIVSTLLHSAVPFYNGGYGPSAKYPYAAISYLLTHQERGSTTVLATPDWGGFITFMGEGKLKAVIDDRNTLLGEAFYTSYLKNTKTDGAWNEYAHSVGAHYFLISVKEPLFHLLKCRDVPIEFHDEIAAVLKIS